MADKCPKCGSKNTKVTGFHPDRSTGEKVASGIGAVGIGVLGALVGGPIGAVAGGAFGKHIMSGLAGWATDDGGTQTLHCNDCGKNWTKYVSKP